MRMIFEEKTKPLPISKEMVWKAYKKVKSNKGSAGIDGQSIALFEARLSGNLYKLWNRMASGSYFPPAVKEKDIEKDNGEIRKLGIPTVADRVAQQVVKEYIEPRLEKEFHDSSYGYRPLKSAHQALASARSNVKDNAWVVDLDITAFFDNVDHSKMMLALERHVEEQWAKMYVKRWLEAPMVKSNGQLLERQGAGTPQGGVISPLLANLYLHYTFDKWMELKFPELAFVRYADDIVIHCKTEGQSKHVLDMVKKRLKECNLSVHPEKTNIIHCKNYRQKDQGKKTKFDFLGFSFQPMKAKSKWGLFLGYDCRVSKKSYSRIVSEFREMKFHRWICTLQELANLLNPKIKGWVQYYCKFNKWALTNVFHRLHNRLIKWIICRYKRFKRSKWRAANYLRYIRRCYPSLFYHWKIGYPIV